jgi:hypothetical protein
MKESKELTSAPNVSIMDEEKVLECNSIPSLGSGVMACVVAGRGFS